MPNQANILVGDNLTLYLGRRDKRIPEDRLAIATSTTASISLNTELVSTANKDTAIYDTFKKVSHGISVEASVIQRDWDAEREQITQFKGVATTGIIFSRNTTAGTTGIALGVGSSFIPASYVNRTIEFGDTGVYGKITSAATSGRIVFTIDQLLSDEDIELVKGIKTLYAIKEGADRLIGRTTYDLGYYFENHIPIVFEFGSGQSRVIGQGLFTNVTYNTDSHALAMADVSIRSSGYFKYVNPTTDAVLLGFGTTLQNAKNFYYRNPSIYYVDDGTKDFSIDSNTIYTDSAKTTAAPAGTYFDGYRAKVVS